MVIICTATNGFVGSMRMPQGVIPLHLSGQWQVWAEGLTPTNIVAKDRDYVILEPTWCQVLDGGPPLYQYWLEGFALGLVLFGCTVVLRRMRSLLHRDDRWE